MKEKIKNLLESISKNVFIQNESAVFNRCEFWFECDDIPYQMLASILALSDEISIGVIGFNNGFYYISVYGISAKS